MRLRGYIHYIQTEKTSQPEGEMVYSTHSSSVRGQSTDGTARLAREGRTKAPSLLRPCEKQPSLPFPHAVSRAVTTTVLWARRDGSCTRAPENKKIHGLSTTSTCSSVKYVAQCLCDALRGCLSLFSYARVWPCISFALACGGRGCVRACSFVCARLCVFNVVHTRRPSIVTPRTRAEANVSYTKG